MKISCQSCQAKYTIADEKVVGKIVKIRCKKCGATIVINGNEDATAASGGVPGAGGAGIADYTQGDEQWTVNVAEGDQRTMSVQDIAQEFKTGVITDDTYCWKDGMNDWLPLREIEGLYSAVTLGPPPALQTNTEGYAPLSLSPSPITGENETVANVNFGLFGGGGGGANGGGAENTRTDVSNNGNAGSLFGSGSSPPAPAASSASSAATAGAARRTGGRGAGGADLFGSAAQAGGENDVLTSAAAANAAAATNNDASKMTGARNENSVLFSLNALTNEPSKPAGSGGGHGGGFSGPGGGGGGRGDTTAAGDGSGLIDIRALAQSMGVENGAKSGAKVDDIMNLSGGGAFSAALAAPVLAPPPADYSVDASSPEGQKNKNMIAIIGGMVFLGICILAAAFMFSGGKKDDKDEALKTAPTTSEVAPTPTASTAAAPTPTEQAVAATPPGTHATAPNTGAATQHNTGGAKPSTGGGAVTAKAGTPSTTPAAAETPAPAAPAKPKSLAEAMQSAGGAPAAKPEAASAGGAMPFDKGAALAALGGVNANACKKPDGPTGPGKVKVTFEPNGSVSRVEFAEGSYAGTPVGGCILGKFRGARIPAFSGPAVVAGKSFAIN